MALPVGSLPKIPEVCGEGGVLSAGPGRGMGRPAGRGLEGHVLESSPVCTQIPHGYLEMTSSNPFSDDKEPMTWQKEAWSHEYTTQALRVTNGLDQAGPEPSTRPKGGDSWGAVRSFRAATGRREHTGGHWESSHETDTRLGPGDHVVCMPVSACAHACELRDRVCGDPVQWDLLRRPEDTEGPWSPASLSRAPSQAPHKGVSPA